MENPTCGDAMLWMPSVRMTEAELVLLLHDLVPRQCYNIGRNSAWRPRASQLATGANNTYERHADSKHCRHVFKASQESRPKC